MLLLLFSHSIIFARRTKAEEQTSGGTPTSTGPATPSGPSITTSGTHSEQWTSEELPRVSEGKTSLRE